MAQNQSKIKLYSCKLCLEVKNSFLSDICADKFNTCFHINELINKIYILKISLTTYS